MLHAAIRPAPSVLLVTSEMSNDVGKTVKNIDEKARLWHKKVLERKNAMEKDRKGKVISVIKKLDDIAREEVKSLQQLKIKDTDSGVGFHIPSIDLEDDDDQFDDDNESMV